jgi:hypothetical protein
MKNIHKSHLYRIKIAFENTDQFVFFKILFILLKVNFFMFWIVLIY